MGNNLYQYSLFVSDWLKSPQIFRLIIRVKQLSMAATARVIRPAVCKREVLAPSWVGVCLPLALSLS